MMELISIGGKQHQYHYVDHNNCKERLKEFCRKSNQAMSASFKKWNRRDQNSLRRTKDRQDETKIVSHWSEPQMNILNEPLTSTRKAEMIFHRYEIPANYDYYCLHVQKVSV